MPCAPVVNGIDSRRVRLLELETRRGGVIERQIWPALIVEVLSPSTTGIDLNTKPGEYLSIATLDAYIVASQTEASVLI
jgi:Uma2 family endonuclease